jgi:hypothetical protein
MVAIRLEADIERATRYLKGIERKVIPRAINRALNRTGTNVRTVVTRHISKETGLTIGKIKQRTTLSRATFSRPVISITAKRSDTNIIEFVTKARRRIGAFDKQGGVTARPWRRPQFFKGAFIVHGKYSNKLIVVGRKKTSRKAARSFFGPSIHREFIKPKAHNLFIATAHERFLINFNRDLKNLLSRQRR